MCVYKKTHLYHKVYNRKIVRNSFSKMVSKSPYICELSFLMNGINYNLCTVKFSLLRGRIMLANSSQYCWRNILSIIPWQIESKPI